MIAVNGWAVTIMARVVRPRKRPQRKTRAPQDEPTTAGFAAIAARSTKLLELQVLWRNAKAMGLLTEELKTVLRQRAEVIKCIPET